MVLSNNNTGGLFYKEVNYKPDHGFSYSPLVIKRVIAGFNKFITGIKKAALKAAFYYNMIN